jgi:UDP-N-acetylglucosamine--N-acetylmuramyl-(pentapeptide) pyrophosphoryl-undecaprenol N-acetylglucosamine transferase
VRDSKEKRRTAVFAGGGTGGHIYPGLAVAEALKLLDGTVAVVWFGSSSGMDRALVEKSGVADFFYGIPSGKFRRYVSLHTALDMCKVFAGFIASLFLLVKIKPCAVFSKGGYVSVPPCFAAKCLRIPVYTHECDFSPGLATRLNAKTASRVFVSYAETAAFFGGRVRRAVTVSGNPVRREFYRADSARGRRFLGFEAPPGKPVLLALGGSLGARQINALVAECLPWLLERFVVVHQTGEHGVPAPRSGELRGNYKAYRFIYAEMPDVISAADVVLSRAGANSLWECATLGKPLVLVPLSGSGTRGDQIENACFFERAGAALVLDGNAAPAPLADALKRALAYMLDAGTRARFARASASLAGAANPARDIAQILFDEVFSL